MELHENKYASKGVAGAGLGTGIAGLALGVLNGGAGLLNGWNGWGARNVGVCCEDPVTTSRYEMSLQSRIAELETQVQLRDANIYTDQKLLDLYKYFDGEIKGINAQLCQQGVVNAQVAANIGYMQNTLNVLSGLTKTVIPIENICPEAMRRYNTWVAPTTPAPDAVG